MMIPSDVAPFRFGRHATKEERIFRNRSQRAPRPNGVAQEKNIIGLIKKLEQILSSLPLRL
jgi:hypothetical protein